MSLAFLAKKSWHTTNLKNVENVWVREQKKEAEEKKLLELQRQIEEERQLEELQELQESTGLVKRDLKERAKLAWMYQGPASNGTGSRSNATNEEFLNGTRSAAELLDDKKDNQVKELEESSKPGSLWLNKVTNDQNEQFARLNEDPLYHLRKRQQMQRKKIMSNPVKMQMAKDKAIQALQEKARKKEKKSKSKKEKKSKKDKKHKKEKKKDKQYEKGYDHETSSSPLGTKRKRSDSRDRDRGRHSDRHERDRDRDRGRHSDRHERDRDRDRNRHSDRHERDRDRDRSRNNDRYDRDRDRHRRGRDRDYDRDGDRDRNGRQTRDEERHPRVKDEQPSFVKQEEEEEEDLGPSKEVLNARSSYIASKASAFKPSSSSRSKSSRAVSDDEKRRKLSEMQQLGRQRDAERQEDLIKSKKEKEEEEERMKAHQALLMKRRDGEELEAPRFINNAKSDLNNKSLEEHIKSKRHFQQRNRADDSFMSR